MMGCGVKVEIGVCGPAIHFVSQKAIRSPVNICVQEREADKGNAAVVLGTSGYNQKIATLLEDKAYMKLKKDPTDSVV
jgi:hypothetical protein